MTDDQDMIGRKMIGQAVIVNECDKPCGFFVAIVIGVKGDTVLCQYLADELRFQTMRCRVRRVTPLVDFGVELHTVDGEYWCEQIGESLATYPDGGTRPWQEPDGPRRHLARPDVLARWNDRTGAA